MQTINTKLSFLSLLFVLFMYILTCEFVCNYYILYRENCSSIEFEYPNLFCMRERVTATLFICLSVSLSVTF